MTPSTWSITQFWRQAWHLLTTQPKLWLLGAAIITLGAGNSFNYNTPDEDQPAPSPSSTSASTTSPTATNSDLLPDFQAIPIPIYGLLTLEIIALIIFGVYLSIFSATWAKGALMTGIHQAATTNSIDLPTVSHLALTKVWPLFFLQLLPLIKVWLISIGLIIPTVIFIGLTKNLIPLQIVIGLAGAVIFIHLAAKILVAQQWAYWHLMTASDLNDRKQAYLLGQTTAKGNLNKTIWLNFATGFVCLLLFVFGLILLSLPGIFSLMALDQQPDATWPVIVSILNGLVLLPILITGATGFTPFLQAVNHQAFSVLTQPDSTKEIIHET